MHVCIATDKETTDVQRKPPSFKSVKEEVVQQVCVILSIARAKDLYRDYLSGLGRAVGPVCVCLCVRARAFELNDTVILYPDHSLIIKTVV